MRLATQSRVAAIFFALICLSAPSFAQYTQTVLHTFKVSKDANGMNSNPLFADPSGTLYGTSVRGGANQSGSFFALTLAPGHVWHETQLYSFPPSNSTSTPEPVGAIVRDAAGNFYGVSPNDGLANCYNQGDPIACGVVWQISNTSSGWKRTIIYTFSGGTDQGTPQDLIIDSAGNLYGVTDYGWGTVFELSPSGSSWTYKLLYAFTGGADGGAPSAIVMDGSGNLLGATNTGGYVNANVCYNEAVYSNGCGVVFELSPASGGTWTESTLYSFLGGNDGAQPIGTIALDPSGNIFGIADNAGVNGEGTLFEVSKSSGSWTETVPYAFPAQVAPSSGVTSDGAGNIFGGTKLGGTLNSGTLFELSPSSGGYTYNTIYSFTESFDGGYPFIAPTIDNHGNLFVSTYSTFAQNYGSFINIEFELSPTGTGGWHGSVVRDFPSSTDGYDPLGGVIRDSAGNLYGTTPGGGLYGWGGVFEVTPSGTGSTEKLIYSFQGTSDGALPSASLALDASGNLYGVAQFGGSNNCFGGCGTVFKLAPATGGTWAFSVLHTFNGARDGSNPTAGVMVDSAGNVYGTSQYGTNTTNCGGGCGTVFKLTPTTHGEWTHYLLFAFSGKPNVGANPALGTVIMDPAGNLYGVTRSGGSGIDGVVYKLTPQSTGFWKESILYNVQQSEAYCEGTLAMDAAGNLYDTLPGGGTYNNGSVFELTPSVSGPWTKTTLFNFNGGSTGGNSQGGVVFDSAGNLYGVNDQIAYKLSPVAGAWQETTLFTFGFQNESPAFTPAIDPAGDLYGTIPNITSTVENAVYELTP
jgi:hypothetical protein